MEQALPICKSFPNFSGFAPRAASKRSGGWRPVQPGRAWPTLTTAVRIGVATGYGQTPRMRTVVRILVRMVDATYSFSGMDLQQAIDQAVSAGAGCGRRNAALPELPGRILPFFDQRL